MNTSGYLGELVQAENLFAVVVAVTTLIHQLLELDGNLIVGEGEHHEGHQAADRGSWRRSRGKKKCEKNLQIKLYRPRCRFSKTLFAVLA